MKLKCPGCSKILSVPDTAAGKVIKCPCGKQLRAPAPSSTNATSPQPVVSQNSASAPALTQSAPMPASSSSTSVEGFGGADADLFNELTEEDLKPLAPVHRTQPIQKPNASSGNAALERHANKRNAQEEMLIGPAKNYEIASLGQRVGARVIDWIFDFFWFACAIGIYFWFLSSSGEEGIDADREWKYRFFAFFIAMIPQIVHGLLISMNGQTLGKKILGTQIINERTGSPVSFLQGYLVRSWRCGVITFIFDCILIMQEDRQTLRDRWAETLVIKL